MPNSTAGLHHFHTRKRMYVHHEPYPHPNKWKRFMDKAIYVIVILGPIMTLPQVFDIWLKKNAAGISIISWGSYLVFSIFWLAYGMMHKEKPLILANIFWIILNVLIVLGALIYG